jgi:hypothetical protein
LAARTRDEVDDRLLAPCPAATSTAPVQSSVTSSAGPITTIVRPARCCLAGSE